MDFAKLTIARKGSETTEIVIGALTCIGRATGNTVVLDDPHVSRHHTVIRVHEDGSYVISDLGSSNGTAVNGRRILLPERLKHDDVIRIGGASLTFRYPPSDPKRRALVDGDDLTLTGADARQELTVVGTGPAMESVFKLMTKAAGSTIAVLVQGETGTGKELVARAIHSVSPRAREPFLAVNCAAMPETLLESQLFGHRRGAFTGADRDRVGLFEAASGGTVFLDEIGEMPGAMQAKFLRVLQEGEVTPLGDNRPRAVDVRVISATNRDLSEEVEQRRFREDLYYRLSGFPITLPPLRERPEDIPVLTERFVATAAQRHGKRINGVSTEALDCLCAYDWPGNVRELQNELQRAVVLAEEGDQLAMAHLSPKVTRGGAGDSNGVSPIVVENGSAPPPIDLRDARAAFEARHIADILRQQGGNISRAAVALGLSRMQLHRKLKEYGIR